MGQPNVAVNGRTRKLTPTLVEQIARNIRMGNRIDTSAATVGISRDQLHAWLAEGARLSGAIDALPGYGRPPERLTAPQRLLVTFSDTVRQAVAESEQSLQARIQMAGAAPSIERRTTRKVIGAEEYVREVLPDGTRLMSTRPVYAEETTEVERPPDWKADAWLLERRHRNWVVKQEVELSGPDGGAIPLEARAADASSRLRQLQNRRAGLPAGDGLAGPDRPAAEEAAG